MTLLIFDCDGVLVDLEVIAFDVLRQMLAALGKPMSLAECRQRFMGRRTSDVLAEIEKELGHPIPADTGARMKALLFERFRRELQPVAGVKDAIARLPGRSASRRPHRRSVLRSRLTSAGLAPLFGNHVFSAEQVAEGKPAPDLFLFAAKSMGVEPRDTIVIEDLTAGVLAARRAGMAVIGFAGASHADDTLADSPARGRRGCGADKHGGFACYDRKAARRAGGRMKLLLVVAAALIDADSRVLIAQRPEGKQLAGLWEFPGGKLHEGERPETALIRELHEELGIEVEEACLAPLTFASHAYPDFHLLMPLYVCRRWRGAGHITWKLRH